jgi:hypothetical protein
MRQGWLRDLYYDPIEGDVLLDSAGIPIETSNQHATEQQNLYLLLVLHPVSVHAPLLGYGILEWVSNTLIPNAPIIENTFSEMAKKDGAVNPKLKLTFDGNTGRLGVRVSGNYIVPKPIVP